MSTALTLVTPVPFQTFQRNSINQADIPIAGTFTGTPPTMVEARWAGGGWTALTGFDTSGSDFSGTLAAQNASQGTLEIRDLDSPAVTDSAAAVAIGEVFLCAGQSNSAGELENFQTYTHATYTATMYNYGDEVWAELADPTGANVSQGSVWPLLATLMMAELNVPVAFICTGVGSTTLVAGTADWLPPSGAQYVDAIARYTDAAPGGLRAILWYQGESDAIAATTQAAYQTALSDLMDAFQTDLGLPTVQMVAALIGQVFTEPDADINAIRLATINRWDNDADILPGPVAYDQSFADAVHWYTDAQAQTLADRWWRVLKAHFFGGASEPARGPSFVSADRTGTTVSVFFTGDVMPLQGQANDTGWSYTDDGTPVTVSSAIAGAVGEVRLTLGGTPSGVELVTWCSGDDGAGGQLRDSGAIAEVPPETFIGQPVTAHGTGTSGGRNWFR